MRRQHAQLSGASELVQTLWDLMVQTADYESDEPTRHEASMQGMSSSHCLSQAWNLRPG